MNRRGARHPPRRSSGSAGVRVAGLEHQPEELLGGVGRARAEVPAVAGPDLRVAEPVCGDGELDGDVGVVAPRVELAAVGEDGVRHRAADGLGQELVDHHPLVVPADDPLRLGEGLLQRVCGTEVGLDVGHDGVVEPQERQLDLADHEVLVVAGVGDERDVLAVARQVVTRLAVAGPRRRSGDLLDEHRRPTPVDALVVEVRADAGSTAVDAVEVERRDAEVADRLGVLPAGEARCRVERHVVVEELAEEREPGRVGRVVRVVLALGRVGDEGDGVGQVVLGVHQPAGLADLDERLADGRRVGGEGRQRREHPAEPALLVERGPWGGDTVVSVSVAHARWSSGSAS